VYFLIGAGLDELALCRKALPRSATVLSGRATDADDMPIGCLVLFCRGLGDGCADTGTSGHVPRVRVCEAAAFHHGRGEPAIRPGELSHSLATLAMRTRDAWHWEELRLSAMARGAHELDWLFRAVADPRACDVASLARICRLSRRGLEDRWRRRVQGRGIPSLKALMDWVCAVRLANARHLGATWEEAAALSGISLRSTWRCLARLGLDSAALSAVPAETVLCAFLDAILDERADHGTQTGP
jgi:hypothetical protein